MSVITTTLRKSDVVVTPWMEAPVSLPAGTREFVIGDIHGMLLQARAVIGAMAAESAGKHHLTFLGDLADRGPHGLDCMLLASAEPGDLGFEATTKLQGNHEILLMQALRGDSPRHWLGMCGGWALVLEMGLDPTLVMRLPREVSTPLIRSRIPGRVLAMLDATVSHRRVGNLMLVHAGVHPRVPFARWFRSPDLDIDGQNQWAWIREPFWSHRDRFEDGCLVVHGHTIEDSIMWSKKYPLELAHRLDGWRIGLDGGSFATGRVAGAEFVNGAYRVFTATGPAAF